MQDFVTIRLYGHGHEQDIQRERRRNNKEI